MAPAKLSDIEIANALETLTGWSRSGDTLVKTYTFKTFVAAIAFVNVTAAEAERVQHHPDLDIRYSKIGVGLSSHDAGGITAKDVAMARFMEQAALG